MDFNPLAINHQVYAQEAQQDKVSFHLKVCKKSKKRVKELARRLYRKNRNPWLNKHIIRNHKLFYQAKL